MSCSSTKVQTISGYVSEYANLHNCSSTYAMQTAIVKEYIKYAKEQDSDQEKEGGK